jgi:hypothetical protein
MEVSDLGCEVCVWGRGEETWCLVSLFIHTHFALPSLAQYWIR